MSSIEIKKNGYKAVCYNCGEDITTKHKVLAYGTFYHLSCYHKILTENIKQERKFRAKLARYKKYFLLEKLGGMK